MLYKLISLHFQIYKISYSSRTGFKQNDITQNSLKQKNMNYWPNKDEIRNNCNLQPREERLVPWRTDYWVSEQLIPSETVPSDQLDPVCAQEKGSCLRCWYRVSAVGSIRSFNYQERGFACLHSAAGSVPTPGQQTGRRQSEKFVGSACSTQQSCLWDLFCQVAHKYVLLCYLKRSSVDLVAL